jgi:hypothetical protein
MSQAVTLRPGRAKPRTMSESTLESLEKELAELDARYEEGYAGKDRHAVDPGGLEELSLRATKGKEKLAALGALTASDNAATLTQAFAERFELYQRELVMVRAAKEMGPTFERFSNEGTAANFVFDRYTRHFAGQSRDTRDLGLLKELIEELKQIKKRMNALAGKKLPEPMANDIALVQQNIERYQVEEREIPRAQADGTAEDQANRLASLANAQFAIYQGFFAGQSRLTRRPALLVRVIENLKSYRAKMFDLKSRGLASDSNNGNIGIVDGRIAAYEKELVEIRKVRSDNKLVDIMGALGNSANDLFTEYRNDFAGKDRANVNLAQLGSLIDRLDEIRRQMEDLGRVEKNDTNRQNQVIVRDYQANWLREYQAVRAAQGTPS